MPSFHSTVLVAVAAGLLAAPAEARFGKGGSSSGAHSSSSSSSSHSSSSSSSSYHSAAPVGTSGTSRSSSAGGGYSGGYGSARSRPWRAGYYSGAFVPMYGYGYGYRAPAYGTTQVSRSAAAQEEPAEELRVTAAAEAMLFMKTQSGGSVGLSAAFEGERWGFSASAQHLSMLADDGSGQTDTLRQLNLHFSYALLAGPHGRLRTEFGADTIFAADVVALGPTGGFSGTLSLGGPFALEGAVTVTPVPFLQLDYRANLAVGLGAVGLRAGWRTQVLDDKGMVDGVSHRDVFMGPWAGAAMVF